MIQLSAAVITKNEAENIGRCLDSLNGLVEEIVVVDSFSTDDTVRIAKEKGARVILHPFEGYVQQKTFCISQVTSEYVLLLDADEWLSPELQKQISAIKNNWSHDCYILNRLNSINDHWIYYGSWYPNYRIRLFDRRKAICTGESVHEKIEMLEGATSKKLSGHLFHRTDKDITDRYQTVNNYSFLAAKDLIARGKKPNLLRLLTKPVFKFWIEYVFRLGFLDGFYGFVIAKSSAHYVFLREAKFFELYKEKKRINIE